MSTAFVISMFAVAMSLGVVFISLRASKANAAKKKMAVMAARRHRPQVRATTVGQPMVEAATVVGAAETESFLA